MKLLAFRIFIDWSGQLEGRLVCHDEDNVWGLPLSRGAGGALKPDNTLILRMINIKRFIVFVGSSHWAPWRGRRMGWARGGREGGREGGEDAGGNKLYLSTVATLLQWLHLPLDTSVATLGFSGKSIKTTEIWGSPTIMGSTFWKSQSTAYCQQSKIKSLNLEFYFVRLWYLLSLEMSSSLVFPRWAMLSTQYWNIEWHDSVTDSSSMVKGQMLWKPTGGGKYV